MPKQIGRDQQKQRNGKRAHDADELVRGAGGLGVGSRPSRGLADTVEGSGAANEGSTVSCAGFEHWRGSALPRWNHRKVRALATVHQTGGYYEDVGSLDRFAR
jgi:hypothetical protein